MLALKKELTRELEILNYNRELSEQRFQEIKLDVEHQQELMAEDEQEKKKKARSGTKRGEKWRHRAGERRGASGPPSPRPPSKRGGRGRGRPRTAAG